MTSYDRGFVLGAVVGALIVLVGVVSNIRLTDFGVFMVGSLSA